MYCGCKSCIVFAAQCTVYVSPVLYLHFCQPSVPCMLSPVLYLHYCLRSVLCIRVLYCVRTTVSAVCCVRKSSVVLALLQAQYTMYLCKSCIVFALLPVQCAVYVSPVLCLHYTVYYVC